MTPTPEQLEAVAQVVAQVQGSDEIIAEVIPEDRVVARAAWDAIAPLVLEQAARACEVVDEPGDSSAAPRAFAAAIRALKVQP